MSNFPPREPPDLRPQRGFQQGGQQPPQQYPPDQNPYNQPPQGYPPQQYPPQQYPPQGGYPPPGQPAPGTGPLPAPHLEPARPPQLGRRGNTGPLRPRSDEGFNAAEVPPIRRSDSRSSSAGLPSIAEHRIEYLAWGVVVLLFGFSIMAMTIDSESAFSFIQSFAPLIAGVVLLASGFAQRILYSYPVSGATWTFAVFCIAFGGASLIRQAADTSVFESSIYFIGLLVISSGLIIILQVFSPSKD